MSRKIPKCPYCGKVGHYGVMCYQKNKILYQRRKKHLVFRKIKPLSATLASKRYSVPSAKKSEQSKRKKLIKELDKYTSILVRLGSADKDGFCTCYTSGVRGYWRTFDAGHYISRRYQLTRWDLNNIRPQTRFDNRTLGGNYKVYEPKIKQELGVDKVQQLWDKAYSGRKIPTYELEELLAKLKQDYQKLLKERKTKGWVC